jgi:hypothetical protein
LVRATGPTQCRRSISNSDGDYLECELPDGAGALIPAWITDPVVCAGFSFGTPVVSVEALVELRSLLDASRVPQGVQELASGTKSPGEDGKS